MPSRLGAACLALFLVQSVAFTMTPQSSNEHGKPAFAFANVSYFHRFTKDDQHEYTPSGQEDLSHWTDMVTINLYPAVKEGEALARAANSVLANYKSHKAMILRTNSVPRTKDKLAEHLIVAVFGRPEFIEAAFARFRMHDGVGSSVVYSHRIYGARVGDAMSAWLKNNGPSVEKSLMQWDAQPSLVSPKKQ